MPQFERPYGELPLSLARLTARGASLAEKEKVYAQLQRRCCRDQPFTAEWYRGLVEDRGLTALPDLQTLLADEDSMSLIGAFDSIYQPSNMAMERFLSLARCSTAHSKCLPTIERKEQLLEWQQEQRLLGRSANTKIFYKDVLPARWGALTGPQRLQYSDAAKQSNVDGRVRAEADAKDREELKEISKVHQGE